MRESAGSVDPGNAHYFSPAASAWARRDWLPFRSSALCRGICATQRFATRHQYFRAPETPAAGGGDCALSGIAGSLDQYSSSFEKLFGGIAVPVRLEQRGSDG